MFLNYCANVNLQLPPGEEEVDVCKALGGYEAGK